MSEPKNSQRNEKLKQLLDKTNNGEGTPADDFEREAFEGYSQLSGTEEALEAKAALDNKIYPALFEQPASGKPLRVYWLAAAAVLLLIGFSVYFILDDQIVKTADIAINQSESQAKVADQPQNAKEEVVQDLLPNTTKENPNTVQKSTAKTQREITASKQKVVKKDDNRNAPASAEVAATQENQSKLALTENEVAQTGQEADEALAKTAQVAGSVAQNAPPSPAAAADQDLSYSSPASQSPPANYKAAAYSRAKKETGGAINAQKNVSLNAVGYRGGETVFKKDLKTMLLKENIDKKIEGKLKIDSDGKVLSVELKKPNELTQTEVEKVTEILKSLNRFETTGTDYEYRFSYIP
jgi:hypothetical protein